MKFNLKIFIICLTFIPIIAQAISVVWPNNRDVYFSNDVVEISFSELEDGIDYFVTISPAGKGINKIDRITVNSNTTFLSFLPYTFAPGEYDITVDGQRLSKMTIVSGVHQSSMLVSQTDSSGWGNFIVSNAFQFGLLNNQNEPIVDIRGQKSEPIKSYEEHMRQGRILLCYMYWTGYVTHKPWGSSKSWGNQEMMDAMRLFNFSTAARLKSYDKLFFAIGSIDEPGLSWGKTPAGGMASGFPNPDERDWYEKHGIRYTQDIANVTDNEWIKYIEARNEILGYNFEQAEKDIKVVWPAAVYSTDSYALHAIMDGTDAKNQLPNDIPSSHVFFDWWGGAMNVAGQIQAEKVMRPYDRLAHAMNGQLDGVRGPQRDLYFMLMNNMLQGGLYSNWWLNTGGMSSKDLEDVNKPAATVGTMFMETDLKSYDIAIMHGFTELAMRQKEMARLESAKEIGSQIKLMLPVITRDEIDEFEFNTNAYEIGPNYQVPLFVMQQVFRRAGYPSQLIDERLIPEGYLNNYKVLVILGQTFEFPKNVMDGITKFIAKGGVVIVDESTIINIHGAVKMNINSDNMIRKISAQISERMTTIKDDDDLKSRSFYNTIEVSWNPMFRSFIAPVKEVMTQQTKIIPAIVTNDLNLAVDSQKAGDGALISVINAYEKLPLLDYDKSFEYPKYNYAKYAARFALSGLSKNAVVYLIEGLDWKKVTILENPMESRLYEFEPAEMKLFLVTSKEIEEIIVQGTIQNGMITAYASIPVRSVLPVTVSILDPIGQEIYKVERSLDINGDYKESFPIGLLAKMNEKEESYTINISTILPGVKSGSKTVVRGASNVKVTTVSSDSVRILDKGKITSLLNAKTIKPIVVAYANDEQQNDAMKLVVALRAKGVNASIKSEDEAVQKVKYPRVWNPFVDVYYTDESINYVPTGEISLKMSTRIGKNGYEYVSENGDVVKLQNNSLVTVGSGGYVIWQDRDSETCYTEGVQLYFGNINNNPIVLNAKAKNEEVDKDFRDKWSIDAWTLKSYNGGFQLPPQLTEIYTTDTHLIVMGDSYSSYIMRILQASEMMGQIVDAKYPGAGKAVVQYLHSPFGIECDVITIGSVDENGINKAIDAILALK